MTPRYDWTWEGGNFFATAAIRFYCWQHCACKSNPPLNRDTSNLWQFMTSLQLQLHDDGSVGLKPSGSGQQQQTSDKGTQVLPPQQQGASDSPSGTCGANRDEFCPKAWDTMAWGPVPHAPPNVTDIVKPVPPKNGSIGVCGNKCSGPSDCSTTEHQYSCSCAFPSASDAHSLGLDPVTPIAICIALFSSALHGSGNGLGGRNLPRYVDSQGVPHNCRCNETTVADSCCRSSKAIV